MDLLLTGGRVVTPAGVIDPGAVAVTAGRIVFAGPAEAVDGFGPGSGRLDVSGQTVFPGFIDLHAHGGGGGDAVTGSTESLGRMAAFLAANGTTGFLGTTMTLPLEMIGRALSAMARFRGTQGPSPATARLLGAHLEGPFINPARTGAQKAEFVRPPSVSEAAALLEAHPGLVRQMTVAPELAGGLELVRFLHSRGVAASIGHSDATYEEARAAFAAGVTHASHTYSAMRGLHHRDPGTVGAVFLTPGVTAEVIADGVHAHPAAVEILIRLKGPAGVALVTDAITFAGMPDGGYDVMGVPILVERGAAFLPDGQTLAGSTLTMARALWNIMAFTGVSLTAAAEMASLTPARTLGLDRDYGSIEPGKVADLAVLGAEGRPAVTVIGGRVVWRKGD